MEERERGVGFGQGEEDRVVLCENKEGGRGLYSGGRGVWVQPFRVGLGGKEILNLKVGGVYGEEWMDVSGEGGNWEERLKLLGSVFMRRRE